MTTRDQRNQRKNWRKYSRTYRTNVKKKKTWRQC